MKFLVFSLIVFVAIPAMGVGVVLTVLGRSPELSPPIFSSPDEAARAVPAYQEPTAVPETEPSPAPTATPLPTPTPIPPLDESLGVIPPGFDLRLGVYDAVGSFVHSPHIDIDHYYISWVPGFERREVLRELLDASMDRGRVPIVTIEPFPSAGMNADDLLADVVAGDYDAHISWVCEVFSEFATPVMARWGHEMEYITGRYDWATEDADGYIAAYRYFVETCRSVASNVEYVWAPAGNKNVAPYWPGEAYVDYVGLTIYGFPAWFVDVYGWELTLEQSLAEKYWRVAHYGKPVIVAELGVTGSLEHQREWLGDGLLTMGEFPLLVALIYFNDLDPVSWGPEYSNPDWRLDPSVLAPIPDPSATHMESTERSDGTELRNLSWSAN